MNAALIQTGDLPQPAPAEIPSIRLLALTVLTLIVAAIAIRGAFLFETSDNPRLRTFTPGLDQQIHWEAARQIRNGLSDNPAFELQLETAPFSPVLLALSQSALGESVPAHRVLMTILGALNAALIFFIAYRLTNNYLSACLSAVFPIFLGSLIYFDTSLEKSTPELFLLLSALCLLVRSRPGKRLTSLLLYGAAVGLLLSALVLSQLNTVFLAPLFSLALLLDSRRSSKNKIAIAVLTTLLPILALTAFQHRELFWKGSGRLFPPRSGIHVLIGFNPAATGAYTDLPDIPSTGAGHLFAARLLSEARASGPLSQTESDRRYLAEALLFVRERPGAAALLILKKAALFFNNYEIKADDSLDFLRTQSALLRMTPVSFGLLVVLGALGLVSLVSAKRYETVLILAAPLFAALMGNLATFVTFRYRILAAVPLAVLAGEGAILAGRQIKLLVHSPKAGRLAVLAGPLKVFVIAALFALFAFRDPMLDRDGHLMAGELNAEAAAQAEVVSASLDATGYPASMDSLAKRVAAVKALNFLERHSDAYRLIEGTPGLAEDSPWVGKQYLLYLLWLGDYRRAVAFLSTLQELKPDRYREVMEGEEWNSPEKDVLSSFIIPHLGPACVQRYSSLGSTRSPTM